MENTEVKEPELDLDDDLLDLDTDLGGELDLNLDMEPAGPDDVGAAPDPGDAISLDDFGSDAPSAPPTDDGDSIALDTPDPSELPPQDDLITIDAPDMSELDAAAGDLPDLDLSDDIGGDLDLGDDLGSGLDDSLTDDFDSSFSDDLGGALDDGESADLGEDLTPAAGDLGDLGGLGGAPDDSAAAIIDEPAPEDAAELDTGLDMDSDDGEITLSDSELGNIVGDEELTKIMDSSSDDDIPMGEAAQPDSDGIDDLNTMEDFGSDTGMDSLDPGDGLTEPDMEVPGLDDIGGESPSDIVEMDTAGEMPELSDATDLTSDSGDDGALVNADELAMDDDEPTTLSESEIDNILGDDFSMPDDDSFATGEQPPLDEGAAVSEPLGDDNGEIPEVYDLESPDFEVIEGEVPGEEPPHTPEANVSAGVEEGPSDVDLPDTDADALAATDDLDFVTDEPTAEPTPDSALPELDDIDESVGLGEDSDGMVTLPGEADLGEDMLGDDLADQVVTSEPNGDLVADVPDAISDLDEGTALAGETPTADPMADFDGIDMDKAPVPEIEEDSAPLDLGSSDEEIDLLEDVPDEALMDQGSPDAGFDLDDEDDEGPIALSQDELDNIMGDVETEDMPEDFSPGQDPGIMGDDDMGMDLGAEASESMGMTADEPAEMGMGAEEAVAAGSGDDLFDEFEDEGPIALSEDELSNIVGDINMDEAEEVEGVVPPSEDDIYQPEEVAGDIIEEDLSGYGDAPIPPVAEPAAEKSAPISPERVDNLIEGTGIARDDMRKMLGYLDGLFDMLPDAAIQAFSKSEYFDLYKNIMNDLDL